MVRLPRLCRTNRRDIARMGINFLINGINPRIRGTTHHLPVPRRILGTRVLARPCPYHPVSATIRDFHLRFVKLKRF